MLRERGKFILDHRNARIGDDKLPVSEGLEILAIYADSAPVSIAEVLWSKKDRNCYIKTTGENFQNHVVLYDDFKDFIYMVDEAYYLINVVRKDLTDFKD